MFSPTYIAALVTVIVSGAALFGIVVVPEHLSAFLEALGALITAIAGLVVLIRRFMKGDISIIGQSKAPKE